jgi:ribosomal protein S18 acetylase RimI-like enzyme
MITTRELCRRAIMAEPVYLSYSCTTETFQAQQRYPVQWLDWEQDYLLAQSIWPPQHPLTAEVWMEAKRDGYEYCAAIQQQHMIAMAAVWRYSPVAWEVAAVITQPAYRRQGYGLAMVSFVTGTILAAQRVATCTTSSTNTAMQRTLERVGFLQKTDANEEKQMSASIRQ